MCATAALLTAVSPRQAAGWEGSKHEQWLLVDGRLGTDYRQAAKHELVDRNKAMLELLYELLACSPGSLSAHLGPFRPGLVCASSHSLLSVVAHAHLHVSTIGLRRAAEVTLPTSARPETAGRDL